MLEALAITAAAMMFGVWGYLLYATVKVWLLLPERERPFIDWTDSE